MFCLMKAEFSKLLAVGQQTVEKWTGVMSFYGYEHCVVRSFE